LSIRYISDLEKTQVTLDISSRKRQNIGDGGFFGLHKNFLDMVLV
jgi:hypothetical protein